jgi:shikimate dehydrogenase
VVADVVFVGVTTGASLVHRAMPAWQPLLGTACEEVNAIRRTGGSLHSWARDPVSAGRVADRIWPDAEGQVICLGAGGTAVALARHLLAARPRLRFACADKDRAAIGQLARLAPRPVAGYAGAGPWDDLVSAAPPGSLIVNDAALGDQFAGAVQSLRPRAG